MTVEIDYGKECRRRLFRGIDKLEKAVSSTLGANGKNVMLIDNVSSPIITKDGVTVAKSIRVYDNVENAGIEIVKQAAMSSADKAGDGTTTSTILAANIIRGGIDIDDKYNKFEVREGMKMAVDEILSLIKSRTTKVEGDVLKNVARISANNNQEMGDFVSGLINEIGYNAPITLSKEIKDKTKSVISRGYTYNKPLYNDWLTHIKGDVYSKIENPKLLLVDDSLNRIEDILSVLQYVKDNNLPLVIMANKIGNDFMEIILRNVYSKKIELEKFAIVETPNYNDRKTESLIDIAECTGAKLFTSQSTNRLSDFKPEDLGDISLFEADSDSTTLIFTEEGDKRASVTVEQLKRSIKGKDGAIKDRIQTRIDRLSNGSAIVYVGASTSSEHKELYDLYEDSIRACKSAVEEGVVRGGGIELYSASKSISYKGGSESEGVGFNMILEACKKPLIKIIESSGVDVISVLKELDEHTDKGFNAKTCKVVDLYEDGIIDPYKVLRVALESALSCANTILTTDCVIYPYDFEKIN